MTTEPVERRPLFLGVRRGYWLVLAVALVVALALPVATLWHSSTSVLRVQTCVFPAAPQMGQPAWLVVVPTTAADRTALEGPWATIVTRWDMVSMTMGALHRTTSGSAAAHGAFAIPLELSMAGEWWAQVALRTPGRPPWQRSVRFAVSPLTAGPPAWELNTVNPSASSASVPWRDLSPCAHMAT